MVYFISLIAIYLEIKTVSYAVYEWRENNNKAGSMVIMLGITIAAILAPIVTYLN